MARGTDEPWRPTVSIILNSGRGRYFVRCATAYHLVENQFAFLSLEFTEVVRQ